LRWSSPWLKAAKDVDQRRELLAQQRLPKEKRGY
jgi:hypothetical protein